MASSSKNLNNIQMVLKNIIKYVENDEDAQYCDLSTEIGKLFRLMRSSRDSEMDRLADALDRELYSAKGALDCVMREFQDIAMYVHTKLTQLTHVQWSYSMGL